MYRGLYLKHSIKYHWTNALFEFFICSVLIVSNSVKSGRALLFKFRQNHIHFTAWKESKYQVISGPYFPAFGPEKHSIFGHFSCSA